MAVIATDTQRFSNLVKREYEPSWAYCREVVVMNDVAQTVQIGAVLGKVTATGKYKLVEATAVDGSEVAAAVVIGDAMGHPNVTELAATTDTKFLVLARGPAIVGKAALSFGASVDTQGEKDALYAQLKAVGIMVADQV